MHYKSANVISPDRTDDVLGLGWKWSERHADMIMSDRFKLHTYQGDIIVKRRGRGSGDGHYLRTNGCPILTMVALSRLENIEQILYTEFNWS